MYILTRQNRVIDYCDKGYMYVGNVVVCEDKGCIFEDATIVYTDKELPADINSSAYYYINGEFIRCIPNYYEDIDSLWQELSKKQDKITTWGDLINNAQ